MNKKLFSVLILVAMLCSLLPATGAIAAPLGQGGGKVYTIQKNDSLSKIADKEYGNVLAYTAIVYYNNEKAKTDTSLTTIADPNQLEVGWSIYLPSAQEAQSYMTSQGATAAAPAAPAAGGMTGTLQLGGSTSVQPLAEQLAAAFMAAHPGVKVEVQGGGSGVGVTSAAGGTVDIGDVSRDLTADEKSKYPDLRAVRIAIDGIAIVTNPGVKLPTLSVEQVRNIFSGQITNFKDVGGPDAMIVVVTREEGSGTRDAFQGLVMGKAVIFEKALVQQSNGQVRTTVATTPNSIGFLSFGYLDSSVYAVPIDNVVPTPEAVLNNTYPIWRYFNMVTKGTPNPLAQAFIDYVFEPDGQAIVKKEYITLAKNTVLASPSNLQGHVSLAGSTSIQPLAEQLATGFMMLNPNVKVEVQGGGSGVGVTSAFNQTADIGDVSRDLTADEKSKYPDLRAVRIAIDGIAIVTNPGVKLPTLSVDQVRSIFSGQITNFKDVGGPDAAIVVVTREEGSGTRDAFQSLVMGKAVIFEKALVQQSNGQVRTTIATTPNSIGFLSFGYLDNSVYGVPINNAAPTPENVLNNTYPIWRYFNMVTNGAPNYLAQAFLNYVFSPDGQAIIQKEYILVKPN
jgi:phosphate transport system substrate-binding protein